MKVGEYRMERIAIYKVINRYEVFIDSKQSKFMVDIERNGKVYTVENKKVKLI